MGVFKNDGLINLSLKEKVNRKQFKNKYKKRKDPTNYEGRKYKDYLVFKKENSNIKTTEMDTVMNSLSGPYIQTFYFEGTELMIGLLHHEKTSTSMASSLNVFQEKLNVDEFSKLFGLILTDRGVEFEIINLFLFSPNSKEVRLNIFYCDPMQSSQKPHVENNHNFIREILPNGQDWGYLTQEKINLMFSHINSTPKENLGNKTPYEIFTFIYGEEIANKLDIQKIEKDEVCTTPHLLK